MKVCLDTNVSISGIFWKGIPGKIPDFWAEDVFDVLASLPVLDEYTRILKHVGDPIDPDLTETWIQMLSAKLLLVSRLSYRLRRSRDLHDDKFLECMLAGEGDYLVTGDKDLPSLNGEMSFPIITPRMFMKMTQ